MASYVNKQLAKERIGAEMKSRGWLVYDWSPQTRDQMGYRSGGGYWAGLATHANYPGVVAGVDVYNAAESGKNSVVRNPVPGPSCAACSGSGIEADALDYAAALANPDESHKVKKDRERGLRVISFGSRVSRNDYHDDGSAKCVACYGRGHEIAYKEEIKWTWPEFQPTPKGKAWHVEAGGKVRSTGVGLSYCDSYDRGWERSVERFVDEIEAAAKRAYSDHTRQSAVVEAAAAIGDTSMLPTEASGHGFTVKVEYEAFGSGVKSVISTTPRLAKPDWVRLRDGFGVSYDRKSGAVSKYKFVTAQEVLDFLVPPSADEVAARTATVIDATPTPEPVIENPAYSDPIEVALSGLPIRIEQRTNADGTTCEVGIIDASSLAQQDNTADEAAAEDMRYLLINADRLDAVRVNLRGVVRQIGGYVIYATTAQAANTALISLMQSLAHASPKVYQTYDEVVSEAERLHAEETGTHSPPKAAEAQAETQVEAEIAAPAIYMIISPLSYDRVVVLPPNTMPLAQCGDFEIIKTSESDVDALYGAMNQPAAKENGTTLKYSEEYATFEQAVAKAQRQTFTSRNLKSLTEVRGARIAVYNPETNACPVEMYAQADAAMAEAVEVVAEVVDSASTTDDAADALANLLYNISMLEDAELAIMTELPAGRATTDFQKAWIAWGWENPGPVEETVTEAFARYQTTLDQVTPDTRWLVSLADADGYLGFSARWDGEALGRWRIVRVEKRDVEWQAMRLASGTKGGKNVYSNREEAVHEVQLQHECDTPRRHEAAPAVEVVDVVEGAPVITEVEAAPVADTMKATTEQQFKATEPKTKRGKTAPNAVQWSMF